LNGKLTILGRGSWGTALAIALATETTVFGPQIYTLYTTQ